MPIQVLSPEVVSKIAAGEVVERPVSVVKELVENSLDAGATRVSIEISGGGVQLIRVSDNGGGIAAKQVELAFERHATSKIASEADIEGISSLGFRGEALPTIASVADVAMLTRHRDEVAGTMVELQNGQVTGKRQQGCPQGTTVTVRNLFGNVPARLKFLKSVSTESSHISHLVTQFVLAYPEVKFSLEMNGRTVVRSSGSGNLRDALVEVYGLETAQAMLEIEPETDVPDGVPLVTGFVGPPSVSRSNRNYLSFFVNRRWVQSRALSFAVEEAYHGMLMAGKHPIVVLSISMNSADVDVNVHPTKREVRFRREGDVFLAVQKAVRGTLTGHAPVPSLRRPMHPSTAPAPQPLPMFGGRTAPPGPGGSVTPGAPQTKAPAPSPPSARLPILRVIGQFHNAYILAEGPDGMALIDQHAAHERIVFERVMRQFESRSLEVQGLLEPMAIDVTARQSEVLGSNLKLLSDWGFGLEPFGERSYLLRSVPAVIPRERAMPVLLEIVDSLGELDGTDWLERMAVSLACHGAVRAGQILSHREMEELVQQLEETGLPRSCPHGRPTMILLSASQLENEFGRR